MDRLDELEVQPIYILREVAVTIAEIVAELEASREPERAGRAMDMNRKIRSSGCAPTATCRHAE